MWSCPFLKIFEINEFKSCGLPALLSLGVDNDWVGFDRVSTICSLDEFVDVLGTPKIVDNRSSNGIRRALSSTEDFVSVEDVVDSEK